MDILIDDLDYNIDCTTNFSVDEIRKLLQTFIYAYRTNIFSVSQKPNTQEYKIVVNINKEQFYIYVRNRGALQIHRKEHPAYIHVICGKIYEMQFIEDGKFHNENGPAKITYNTFNDKTNFQWYRKGKLYNVKGPASAIWIDNILYSEYYDENSNIYYMTGHYKNGILSREEYYNKDGAYHRENKPAILEYDLDGSLQREIWYKNSTLHCLNGPAIIQNTLSSKYKLIPNKLWYVNNKLIDITLLPVFDNKKISNNIPLTKSTIIEAMLFDREYGEFLLEKYNQLHSNQ